MPCAADLTEHRLIIHGNEAFNEAELQARPTAGENPNVESDPLQSVPLPWLRGQTSLSKLASRQHTGIYHMPQLSMDGAFCIEASLGHLVLQYAGVPINLLRRLQVSSEGSMV